MSGSVAARGCRPSISPRRLERLAARSARSPMRAGPIVGGAPRLAPLPDHQFEGSTDGGEWRTTLRGVRSRALQIGRKFSHGPRHDLTGAWQLARARPDMGAIDGDVPRSCQPRGEARLYDTLRGFAHRTAVPCLRRETRYTWNGAASGPRARGGKTIGTPGSTRSSRAATVRIGRGAEHPAASEAHARDRPGVGRGDFRASATSLSRPPPANLRVAPVRMLRRPAKGRSAGDEQAGACPVNFS